MGGNKWVLGGKNVCWVEKMGDGWKQMGDGWKKLSVLGEGGKNLAIWVENFTQKSG